MNTGSSVSTFLAALLFCSQLQAQGSLKETIDVVGQGMAGPVVSTNGATLIRTKNGLTASISMPTPVSGSYNYPAGNAFQPLVFAGHPEAFTGWMFVFNNPEGCTDPCNGDDLGDTPARGGAFNFAGHIVGGSTLNLTGHVSRKSVPFEGAPGVPIDNPFGAEVHLAVAPHGGLQPDLLPTQITFPIGTSAEWWLAIFLP